MLPFKFLLVLFFLEIGMCENWAILIAGSNTYDNYRHQADICQAYQELHQAGLPDERIIVWMYDDIAYNPSNPKQGTIINYFGGDDVYHGVPKDYTGADIVPENFMKLLRGEDMAGIGSGKSLKSGPNDNVFIYFSDHGGPGILYFPDWKEWHVADMIDTLEYMHKNYLFKELVFYVEACESGSMFNNILPDDWNIYAVTASNPTAPSWGCDYDTTYGAVLNDCWSRDFLNDTRKALKQGIMDTRTLGEQFDSVLETSTQSPECSYGDKSIRARTLNQFQGIGKGRIAFDSSLRISDGYKGRNGINSREVKLRTLERNLESMNGELRERKRVELEEYKIHMHDMDIRWNAFATKFNLRVRNEDQSCHPVAVKPQCMKNMVETVKFHCGNFDEYTVKYLDYLHFACLDNIDINDVAVAMKNICSVV